MALDCNQAGVLLSIQYVLAPVVASVDTTLKEESTMNERSIPASDEAWEDRSLGSDEAAVKVVDEATTKAVDEAAGTQLISIRMQKSMIDEIKVIAAKNGGMGYQTLIKQVLQRFIDSEKRMVWNEYVSRKLKEQQKEADSDKARAKQREKKAA